MKPRGGTRMGRALDLASEHALTVAIALAVGAIILGVVWDLALWPPDRTSLNDTIGLFFGEPPRNGSTRYEIARSLALVAVIVAGAGSITRPSA